MHKVAAFKRGMSLVLALSTIAGPADIGFSSASFSSLSLHTQNTELFQSQAIVEPAWRYLQSFAPQKAAILNQSISRSARNVLIVTPLLLSLSALFSSSAVGQLFPMSKTESISQPVTNVKLERAIPLDHVNLTLDRIDGLVKDWTTNWRPKNSEQKLDFKEFQRTLATRVRLADDTSIGEAIYVFFVRDVTDSTKFEKWIGINLAQVRTPLETASRGGKEATQAKAELLSLFLEAGHVLRTEDGQWLDHFVKSATTSLAYDTTLAFPSIQTIQTALRPGGAGLAIGFTRLGSKMAIAGVKENWILDPSKPGTAGGQFTPFLWSKLYSEIKAALREKQTEDRRKFLNVLFQALLMKEGRTLRDMALRPEIYFETAFVGGKVEKGLAAQAPLLAKDSLFEAAAASLTYQEALGYEVVSSYLQSRGYTHENLYAYLLLEKSNPAISALIGRFYSLGKAVENAPAHEQLLTLRANVFQEEIREAIPEVYQFIMSRPQSKNVYGLQFLMNRILTGEMEADAKTSSSGNPDRSRNIRRQRHLLGAA